MSVAMSAGSKTGRTQMPPYLSISVIAPAAISSRSSVSVKEAQERITEGLDGVFQGGTANSRVRLKLFGQRRCLKLEQYILEAGLPELRGSSGKGYPGPVP